MTDFVLNMTGLVPNMTQFVISMTEFSLKMNGLVLNIKWQEKKKGTHGSECTWCAEAGQNGCDHMVREPNRELTNQNGLGVPGSVRTELAIW